MPQAPNYHEITIRDAIISQITSDSYLQTIFTNPVTNTFNVSKLSVLDFTVPHLPAVSVDYSGKRITYNQNNGLEENNITYTIDVIAEHENRETACDNAFKYCKDIKHTLEGYRDLGFNADYSETTEIRPTAYGKNNMWTFVFSFDLLVKDWETYLKDLSIN